MHVRGAVSAVLLGASTLAALALAAPAAATPAPSPALRAKQARARAVLAQVNALGIRFGKVVDAWDGARIQLAASERRLAANTRALRRARRQTRIADGRLAARLVAVYKGGEPDLGAIVLGASSLSNLIDRMETAKALVGYDRQLATAAARSRAHLAAAQKRLRETTREKRTTVARLAAGRKKIAAMLAQRRRLLSSVRAEVAVLERQEAARQRRLAAEARARLAREQAEARAKAAAQAKAEAAAKAKALAAAKAEARAAATPPAATIAATTAPTTTAATTTAAVTTPSAPATTAVTTTGAATTTAAAATTATATATTATATTTAATTTTASTTPPNPGPGVPEAAAIALRYVGIPYKWGGASPATGFDCSGLVMYVYAQLGIQLPHQAAAQYAYGVPVSRSQLLPGDLVFYDGLSHVAIYIGNGDVVHAPDTGDVVKIVPLADAGASYVGARRLSLP